MNTAPVIATVLRDHVRGRDSVLSREAVSSASWSTLNKSAFRSSGFWDEPARATKCFGVGKLVDIGNGSRDSEESTLKADDYLY